MERGRRGPALVAIVIALFIVGVWLLTRQDSQPKPGETRSESVVDILEAPDLGIHQPSLPLGLVSDPAFPDVKIPPHPPVELIIPEADLVEEEAGPAVLVPRAEEEDLLPRVEAAMRDVVAALCHRAEDCCPGQGACDLEVIRALPMDQLATEMVKRAGEGAHMDDEALDQCLVALRDFDCDGEFEGVASARCHPGEDGEQICEEVPAKQTMPEACRRMMRGRKTAGEPCDSDHACAGESVCVRVIGAQSPGYCQDLADRGQPCTWSAGCRGELLCVHGVCGPPRGAGQACEGRQPWCVGGRCRVGTCAFGLTCMEGLCRVQGRGGAGCLTEEDCVRGMVCEPELGCRLPMEGEWVAHEGLEPHRERSICKNFRRLNEQQVP